MSSNYRPPEPKLAAGILLLSEDGRVLIGERSARLPFMPQFLAFPGGRVDAGDEAVGAALFGQDAAASALTRLRAAALRELAEEVAVVLDGDVARPIPPELRDRPLLEIYAALGAKPVAEHLEPAGRWVTPESAPVRFDTTFFLAKVRDACPVAPAEAELAWARFTAPGPLLEAWRRLTHLAAPPTVWALEVLAHGPIGASRQLASIREACGVPPVASEPIAGIRVLPLLTPTLPPAHHTNTYVVGDERLVIIDPATYQLDEREKLLDAVEERVGRGARVQAVVLTHHHPDHVGAARPVADALGVPVLAHPVTRDLLRGRIEVDGTLDEGDVLDLGAWPAGGPGARFELEVSFTPGHAPGHIVLHDRRPAPRGAAIVGDMVAGLGTIVIDPPEGNMAEYLRQLARLRARPNGVLFPAHGPPLVNGHAKLDEYIAHRLQREEKIVRALAARGEGTPDDLLAEAYADTPAALHGLAARSCLAHLEKLVEDGRALRQGDRFRSAG